MVDDTAAAKAEKVAPAAEAASPAVGNGIPTTANDAGFAGDAEDAARTKEESGSDVAWEDEA